MSLLSVRQQTRQMRYLARQMAERAQRQRRAAMVMAEQCRSTLRGVEGLAQRLERQYNDRGVDANRVTRGSARD
jgi:nitrogen-specific signal transduction histidine kinase